MDSNMSFTGHIDVTVGKALAMLGFVKRLSCKFEFSRQNFTIKLRRFNFVSFKAHVNPTSCHLNIDDSKLIEFFKGGVFFWSLNL
jgi:hypothetical protein